MPFQFTIAKHHYTLTSFAMVWQMEIGVSILIMESEFIYEHSEGSFSLCGFRLPSQCKYSLCSSGMLHSADW
jgi:hypothetical protein